MDACKCNGLASLRVRCFRKNAGKFKPNVNSNRVFCRYLSDFRFYPRYYGIGSRKTSALARQSLSHELVILVTGLLSHPSSLVEHFLFLQLWTAESQEQDNYDDDENQ